MIASIKKIAMGGLAAATLGAATPADAQRFHGYRGYHGGYHRGIGPGAAIGLGLAGAALATGAYSYYNRPYYNRPYGAYGYYPY